MGDPSHKHSLKSIPNGTVGIPCGSLARYTAFTLALTALHIPPNTRYYFAQSVSVVDNMNEIVRNMVGSWLLVLGDDHSFQPDLLSTMLRLMYERDLDILVPLVLKRTHPYAPVVYDELGEEGMGHVLDLDGVPDDATVIEVAGAGTAGMVIRKRVLDAVGEPWFKSGPLPGHSYQLAEDLRFCLDARKAGFKIHCTPRLKMSHLTTVGLWPDKHDGRWGMRVAFNEEDSIFVPRSGIM